MLVINGTYYEYSIRTLGSALGDGLAVGNAAFAYVFLFREIFTPKT